MTDAVGVPLTVVMVPMTEPEARVAVGLAAAARPTTAALATMKKRWMQMAVRPSVSNMMQR